MVVERDGAVDGLWRARPRSAGRVSQKRFLLRWGEEGYLSAVREWRLGNYLGEASPFGTPARTSVVLNSERENIDPPPNEFVLLSA